MAQSKISPRQLKVYGTDSLEEHFIKKTADDSTPYALAVGANKSSGAPALDLTGHRIINVAEAVLDSDAPNWGQVRNLVLQGEYRGEIEGYVVQRGSQTKYVQDADKDGVNEETNSPTITGGLYLFLSAVNGRQPGDVARWTGTSWVADNSQGSFDTTSPAADPGGNLAGALYLLSVGAQPGDYLPRHTVDTGEWTSDVYIKWNPSYDEGSNQNIGRWEIWGSAVNIPFATKTNPGKVQIYDGLTIASGLLSVDIDPARALSWSGTSPNRRFGLNIVQPFTFTSGALDLKRYALDPNDTGSSTSGAGDNGGLGYYGKVGFYINSNGELVGQLRYHTLRLDYELGQWGHYSAWALQNIALVSGGALTLKTSGAVTINSTGVIGFAAPVYLWYRGPKLQGGGVVVLRAAAGTTPALGDGQVLVWRFNPAVYNVGSSATYPQAQDGTSGGNWVVLSSGIGGSTTSFESPWDIPVAVRQGNRIFFLDGTVLPVPSSGSYTANLGDVHWDLVYGKPSTFPPSAHTHPLVDTFFTNTGTRSDGYPVRFIFRGAGSSIKGQRAVEELLRLVRRLRVEPQTYYRFAAGQGIHIQRGLPSGAATPAFERQIRGILIVFRAPQGGNSGYLLGNGSDPNSVLVSFGGGNTSVIRTGSASGLGTVRLLTERGIEYTYDGFKAEYFDRATSGQDGSSNPEEWHVGLLYWDGAITWGTDERVIIYPHGAGAPSALVQVIDIARIALLTDDGDLVNVLEDGAKLGAVEEPVHAIRDVAADSTFTITPTHWQAVDSGVTVTVDTTENALKIVEPASGAPTAGLAQLQDSGDPPGSVLVIRPQKRYRLTFRARANTTVSLKVQLVAGATVYWEQTVNLGTSYSSFSFYLYTTVSGLRIRLARASGNYSGRSYWIDDIYLYQCGAYVDLRPDGITEHYWYSSNHYVSAYASTPPRPPEVVHANARLVAANLERRTSTDHVVVFSRNEDEPVQHLQKLSLTDLKNLLNLAQKSVSVDNVTLAGGVYDIPLPAGGAVLDPDNPRTSFNVYINGIRLTQDASTNAYSVVTDAQGLAQAIRLHHSGIGYDLHPTDRIDVVYWRA